jgi:hypothetical protein
MTAYSQIRRYDALSVGRLVPMFRTEILPPTSVRALNMLEAGSFESVPAYKTTRLHILKHRNFTRDINFTENWLSLHNKAL